MFICNLHCQYAPYKTHPDAKISIVPEEGWFGQPKYSTPSKKTFYVVSVSAFILFIFCYSKMTYLTSVRFAVITP